MADSAIIDFDNIDAKRAVLSKLGALRGCYRVEVTRHRPRRSDRQNRFYWPCIVAPLAEWMSEQEADRVPPQHAHEILKARFLSVDVIDKRTGEVLGQRVRSTTELDTKEFAEYVDRCAAWLASFFGIIVPA